jgi:hybrid cluster-associated redox disulfide protein
MRVEGFTLVDDVMRRRPATIRVFLDFKMNCVGCPIASFHSVEEACEEHGIDIATLLAALRAIAV